MLIPEDQGTKLFKWVAILTGSKNAIKGAGFFLGGFLLQFAGFKNSLWIMAALVGLVFIFSWTALPGEIGQSKAKNKLKSIFSQGRDINLLSSARVFLFGARDIWFVVAVPVYMTSILGWNFSQVGAFMAVWVIIYGAVQAYAPILIRKRTGGEKPDGKTALELASLLVISMTLLTLLLNSGWHPKLSIIIGLYIFGAVFAVNSSVHSFLIIDYADGDKAAINVGFYYMANALGRLSGTLLSGILYQNGGIFACLTGSIIFLILTTGISVMLPRNNKSQTPVDSKVKEIIRFRHWFCRNYDKYADNEDKLPFDAHMLIALAAPRLVYVSSATEDKWADPEGEFEGSVLASKVYEKLGLTGLSSKKYPEPNDAIHGGKVGYHLRKGKHSLNEFDWNKFMDFADKHMK